MQAQIIVDAWQIQNLMVEADKLEIQEIDAAEYKGSPLQSQKKLMLEEVHLCFCSIHAFDWSNEVQMHWEKSALFKVHRFKCKSHPNHHHRNIQDVWPNFWDCDSDNLTLKINHHNDQESLYWQFKSEGITAVIYLVALPVIWMTMQYYLLIFYFI